MMLKFDPETGAIAIDSAFHEGGPPRLRPDEPLLAAWVDRHGPGARRGVLALESASENAKHSALAQLAPAEELVEIRSGQSMTVFS